MCLLLSLFVSTGCTWDGQPPSQWLGRDANEFFKTFGLPLKAEQLPSGGKMYAWENRSSWRAITGQIPMLCHVFIVTDPSNVITKFRPQTGGLSRCHEKFLMH